MSTATGGDGGPGEPHPPGGGSAPHSPPRFPQLPPHTLLRPMRWWDIPAITVLDHVAFPEDPWSVDMFWSELAEVASRYYLVAEEFGADDTHPDRQGPRIVGFAGLLIGAGEAEVLTIAVDPAREGHGLGTVLLTELLREAARRECDDVVLEVRADNLRAQELYRRLGFVQIGMRRGYYQPANVDAWVMRSSGIIVRFGEGDGPL